MSTGTNGVNWYVDSCASKHISAVDEGLRNQRKCSVAKVTMANKQGMSARSTGDMSLEIPTINGVQEITARNVLHVPESSVNLLSVSQMVKKGLSVLFSQKINEIRDEEGNNLGTMSLEGGIYKLDVVADRGFFAAKRPTAKLWHRRLGHLHYRDVSKLSNDTTTGIKLSNIEEKPCIPYIKGKIAKKPFPKEGKRAKEILEVIHSDLCGPMENASIGGAKYFITLIDDFSRKVFVYFLTEKGQSRGVIVDFRTFLEKQTTKEIKSIRTDNGGEFVNRELEEILKKSGIRHQRTSHIRQSKMVWQKG